MRRLFPVVQRLVAAAPRIPGWNVISLRPRRDLPEVQVGAAVLRLDRLTFHVYPIEPGAGLDLTIYVADAHPGRAETRLAVYLLLDGLLGELDAATKLDDVDLRWASSAPPDARPLRELADVVDAMR